MKLSRAEKNKELYEQLLADPEAQIQSNDLEKIANRLSKIDANNFTEMNTLKASENPLHIVENNKPTFFEEKEVEIKQEHASNTANLPKFNNEYLDDFINEVKQYNISKGNRTQEDTQTALFNKILKESKDNELSSNIKNEEKIIVKQAIEENVSEEKPSEETKQENKIERLDLKAEIKELFKDTKKEAEEVNNQDTQKALEITQELLERTSTIKTQMDNYDSKLVDVDDKMDKVNKTLNIVLVTLFLALIALLVVIVIYVVTQKGIL